MNEAEKAYQAAQKEIARAAKAGETRLSFDAEPFRALERLPPELAALAGLQVLDLDNTQVADLAPLAALTGLQELWLDNTRVADLAPLAALTGLQVLWLDNTQVADLAPLAALTGLQFLDLNNTQVADLAPLAALTGLQDLRLDNTQVADLAPLAALTGLERLDLDNTQVADLRPLAGLARLSAESVVSGLSYRSTPATERDARLAELSRIKDSSERARETLAYLQTLPPWPDPYTPEATPDGSPPQPIGTMPAPPEQDPALPLVWSERGFTFAARSVTSDPVTEAALAELRDLLEDLRRKGNRHDDLYRLAGTLLERSAGAVADLNMVSLHLSYQRLRRLHANRQAREELFDAETVTTLEAVLNTVPAVTLADEGVRTLIERQEADRAERRSAAETEAETRMLEAVEKAEAVFAPVVQETARETLRPGVEDRLSGTKRVLSLNAMIAVVSSVAVKVVDDAIGGVIGNFAYEHGAALLAQAAAVSWDAFVWAQSVLARFRVEYEIAMGIAREAASAPRAGRKGDRAP